MRFDWKDGLLIALGFAVFAAILGGLRHLGLEPGRATLQGLGAAAVFGPSALRRYLFGQPVLGRMRRGLGPSLVSILGLLGTFFGIGIMVLALHRLTQPKPSMPDFRVELSAWENSALELDFGDVGETAQQTAERRARERADRATELEREVASRAHEWSMREQEERRLDWTLATAALSLLGLGALALRVRYEPVIGQLQVNGEQRPSPAPPHH
jgi:hypothetical protein